MLNRKAPTVGNKKFGIDPNSIIKSLFPPPGASLATTNGQISQAEFLGFWTTLMGLLPTDENPVLPLLCTQLEERLKLMYAIAKDDGNKKKKDKNIGPTGAELLQILEANSYVDTNSIVTTLAFFIFTPFKFNPKVLAEWYNTFQRTDYALSVPECVKNLALFIKYRCLLTNVGWDDTEFRYDVKDKNILNIQFKYIQDPTRDTATGAAGNIDPNGDVFAPLIQCASKILQQSWIPMLSLDETDITSNECSFIYTYLSDIIHDFGRDYQLAIISSLFDRAQLVSNSAQYTIREQTFLSIAHMTRSFFTHAPITNVSLLRRGLVVLQTFYIWQHPYGKVAESLILLIQNELLSPGYAYRTFIQRESLIVDYKSKSKNVSINTCAYNTKSDTASLVTPYNGYKYNKPLFYLYDSTDKRAYSILTVLDAIDFEPDHAISVTQELSTVETLYPPLPIMFLTILQAIDIDAPFVPEEVQQAKYIPTDKLIPFYTQIMNFHKHMASTGIPTVSKRRDEMIAFKKNFLATAKECFDYAQSNSLGPSVTSLPTTKEKNHRYSPLTPNIEHIHIPLEPGMGFGDAVGFPCHNTYTKLLQLFESYVPSTAPARNLQGYQQQSQQSQIQQQSNGSFRTSVIRNRDDESMSHEQSTSRTNMNDEQLVSTIRNSSIYNPNQQVTSTIQSQIQSTSESGITSQHTMTQNNSSIHQHTHGNVLESIPTVKKVIRLVILGSAKLLHRVITAYQKILISHPIIFDYIDPQFLIIPAGENWLCNYLARNDLWYYRHIYAPMVSPALLLPWLRDEELRVTPSTLGSPYPCQFFRSCISQYAQQALYSLPITIYKVDCWTNTSPGNDKPACTAYFIQRLELGVAPAIEDFRASNPQFAHLRNDEIVNHKLFSFTYIEMSIGYSKSDLMGVTQAEVVEDNVQFQSLVLSNIPTKNVGAVQIIKTVEIDEKEMKKKIVKEQQTPLLNDPLTTNQDLTAIPDPTVVPLEVYISAPKLDKTRNNTGSILSDPKQHISDMHCSSLSAFKVRVDGVNYGIFKHIHISPCTTTTGALAKFNISTFFPVAQ